MSTQVTTWPEDLDLLDQADGGTSVTSATGQDETGNEAVALQSAFEHAPAMAFSAIFAAEVALVAGGLMILLASLATLVLQGALR